jgi:hypothetical protein
MRTITDHIVEGDAANHQVEINVRDEPGSGGANHIYGIEWPTLNNPDTEVDQLVVSFQNGPIKEFGVNGVTQEALLAIVIDRLRSFQAGPFACEDNAAALGHCDHALAYLQQRTRARIARGVEGTHQK